MKHKGQRVDWFMWVVLAAVPISVVGGIVLAHFTVHWLTGR